MNRATEKTKEDIVTLQANKPCKQLTKTETKSTEPIRSNTQQPKTSVPVGPKARKSVTESLEKLKTKDTRSDSPKKPVEVQGSEKTKEQVHQEREARRLAKIAAKKKVDDNQQSSSEIKSTSSLKEPADELAKLKVEAVSNAAGKAKASKAERRAIQEAQRASKAKALEEKKPFVKQSVDLKKPLTARQPQKSSEAVVQTSKTSLFHKVKLFKHLYSEKCDLNINVNQLLHPAIVQLGVQFANDTIVGSNARCYAFLNAMKIVSPFL